MVGGLDQGVEGVAVGVGGAVAIAAGVVGAGGGDCRGGVLVVMGAGGGGLLLEECEPQSQTMTLLGNPFKSELICEGLTVTREHC